VRCGDTAEPIESSVIPDRAESSSLAANQVYNSIEFIVVMPAKAGIVRLKAHLVREVEVLFRYAISGL